MLTVILPASGFGVRNPDQPVKELIIHRGRSLIELSFDHLWQGQNAVSRVIVLTRQAKLQALEHWLVEFKGRTSFKVPVDFLIHEPNSNEEWPLTIMASQSSWSQTNLILLPDTHLSLRTPLVETVQDKLNTSPTVWGIFKKKLEEVCSYGNVDPSRLTLTEKPREPESPWIWGCFGFQKPFGRELLENLERSTQTHEAFSLPPNSTFIELDGFEDLSRVKSLGVISAITRHFEVPRQNRQEP
jgi:hypothetical protein